MSIISSLNHRQLKKYWDLKKIPFDDTSQIKPYYSIIGQERAVKAMEFGTRIDVKGYNLYISGISGTGKTTYARDYLNRIAKDKPIPNDWCYVYNFENPSQPVAVELPAGKGKEFYTDMEELLDDVKIELSKAFSGEEYENERALLFKEIQEKKSQLFNDFSEYAKLNGFQVNTTNSGIYFSPVVDDRILDEKDYSSLPEEEKRKINDKLTTMQLQAVEVMRKIKELEKEVKIKARELDNRIGIFALRLIMDDINKKYKEFPKIIKYLESLQEDILENLDDFKDNENSDDENPIIKVLKKGRDNIQRKYMVKLLIDNSDTRGAPVVIEYNPSYNDLFGTLEYENQLGTLSTDFTMIKNGSIHRANGGYLILQAKDVLSVPFMWEGLKKVLKTRTITIENLRDQYGLATISTLKPEAIPIDIKVVLVGSNYLYQMLFQLDEDFGKLFKIKVDFDEEMDANEENLMYLAGFINGYCKRENSRHFSKEAVVKIAEYSSRLVENQGKLSTRFNDIVEVLAESNTWAEIKGHNIVDSADVKIAIQHKEYRSNKYDAKLFDMLKDGTIMVDTEGEVVGQINGLSILNTGDFMFGKPSKITATTYMGKSGIVNIEREVAMSGTSHSKGVMILAGYIGDKYAQEIPLSLSSSITFEQLYSGIDGDSASSTELYAILSSLTQIPIKQSIAVTGSVNQKGEIQPVGGVTLKIEGYFYLCKHRGLTGKHGVIIPYQNIKNLVLKDEVIEAVKEGLFHIYPVKTVDEGIEILTGVPAGKKLEEGYFEKDTIHEKAYNRLREYALNMINFGKD